MGLFGGGGTAKKGIALQKQGLDLNRKALAESRRANRAAEIRAEAARKRSETITQSEIERAARDRQIAELGEIKRTATFRGLFRGSLGAAQRQGESARFDGGIAAAPNTRAFKGPSSREQQRKFFQKKRSTEALKPSVARKTGGLLAKVAGSALQAAQPRAKTKPPAVAKRNSVMRPSEKQGGVVKPKKVAKRSILETTRGTGR